MRPTGHSSEDNNNVNDHQSQATKILAPFNPTSAAAQTRSLQILELTGEDALYDLGCGDGRFLIRAAESVPKLKCVGIELDSKLSARAFSNVSENGMLDRIGIIAGDVVESMSGDHLAACTAVFVYLLPKGLQQIESILKKVRAKKNGRVLSYLFQVPGW
eukprot:CAMPEP_0196814806 /NCGR_PEP_ID=MMETSP1362-20130617/45837_1 /TAXON_ID=163516 /ORGANISM="Leptocylindrus danicus, Strain CCMP1856" /LENGTH=159 /DNA_ID=CAMNT_0042191545 /DNA_START=122 /DNA_END=598 /DNA_ORIENTATION=+